MRHLAAVSGQVLGGVRGMRHRMVVGVDRVMSMGYPVLHDRVGWK